MEQGYAQRYQGRFQGILQWPQLDALWMAVREQPQGWFLVEPGQALPEAPLPAGDLLACVESIDTLLRQEHPEDYCGIVYADDPAAPTLIKVFDPRGLGSACSCSAEPTAPRWILSRLRPEPLVPTTDSAPAKAWWKFWSAPA